MPKTRSHSGGVPLLHAGALCAACLANDGRGGHAHGLTYAAASRTSSLACLDYLCRHTAQQHQLFCSHLPGTSARSKPGSWLILVQPFGRAKCYKCCKLRVKGHVVKQFGCLHRECLCFVLSLRRTIFFGAGCGSEATSVRIERIQSKSSV